MSGVQVFSQTSRHFCCNFKYLTVLVKKRKMKKRKEKSVGSEIRKNAKEGCTEAERLKLVLLHLHT